MTLNNTDFSLIKTPDFLGLQRVNSPQEKPFFIDFLAAKLRFRSHQAGLRNELLARAIGLKPAENPTIIDATAGVGRDSFILASLGFKITLIEKNDLLHALLADAIERAGHDHEASEIVSRLTLIHADSIEWLKNRSHEPPEVIYLDPMFPARKKSALVKKEMVILQDLLGEPDDPKALLDCALACASKRVVVKRPRLAESVANYAPHHAIVGKTSRFDVYITNPSLQAKR